MRLAKKLPIGLGLTCLMLMSSCSKEDAQIPQPEVGKVNMDANMRGGLIKIAYLAPTIGPAGESVYPKYWSRHTFLGVPPQDEFPSGTSNLTHLFGDISLPWMNPVEAIPLVENMNSFVTTITRSDMFDDEKLTIVKTTIKNLSPNHQYKFTYYVSSNYPVSFSGNYTFANRTRVKLIQSNGSTIEENKYIFVEPTKWKVGTITFTATGTEAELQFSAATAQPTEVAFANIFIDKNSIKKIQ